MTLPRYFLNISAITVEALLSWQVPTRFTIEYRGKELKHHSLGQRASALILFVLSQQENDVLSIDQPEDDLDNQTIYEDVIKLIRSLKPKTQFIFATHNANFPVLGDAEQIISCSYSDDTVHTISGSIDCPQLQKQIVDIMEGGKEAFEQRRRRYEIWKPMNFKIIGRNEDGRNQFKANVTNETSLAQEMVAFSNSGGGTIFIGVSNDGTFSGLRSEDMGRLNQLTSNAASQQVRPPINPQTENINAPEGLVMRIVVPDGIAKPYMDKNGVIWVKSASDKRKATSREEIQRLYQRAGLIHGDEIPVPGLTIADLDSDYFKDFFERNFGETVDDQELPLPSFWET